MSQLSRVVFFLRNAPKGATALCVCWDRQEVDYVTAALRDEPEAKDFSRELKRHNGDPEWMILDRRSVRTRSRNVQVRFHSMTTFRREDTVGLYLAEIIWPDIPLRGLGSAKPVI